MEGLLVYVQQEFPWPAHRGTPFKSFLFCLETSIVRGLISSNFIFCTLKKKSALSIFFIKNALKQKKKKNLLLLLMSCCYSPVLMSDLKIN